MSTSEVARRYAKALLALVKQKGTHQQAMKELKSIRDILAQETTIAEFFSNPLVSPEQKKKLVQTAFQGKGLTEEVLNLMTLLVERHRIGQFNEIVEAFQDALDLEEGITRGIVRAAKPLSDEARKQLESQISTSLKKKIMLTFKEDPKILGGVIAQVGGWTFDDSLETHLKKLNEELNRSAN